MGGAVAPHAPPWLRPWMVLRDTGKMIVFPNTAKKTVETFKSSRLIKDLHLRYQSLLDLKQNYDRGARTHIATLSIESWILMQSNLLM